MARYVYNALKNNSQIVKGEIEAASPREARDLIRKLGFVPTKVYTEYENRVEESTEFKSYKAKNFHFSLQEKILFTSELETMLSAGIPVIEALSNLEKASVKLKIAAEQIRNGIMSGLTFSQSLESIYGEVFGPVYIGIIKTGEASGQLEAALLRNLTLLRKQENIKDKIVSASIYPSILLVMMFGLLVLFSKLIFPAFAGMIIDFGGEIPFFARLLNDICTFTGNFWWLIILGFFALCGFMKSLLKNSVFKNKYDTLILQIPVVSEFVKYINLSNFMTVLYLSYDAGVPITTGIELSEKTVGNTLIRRQVHNSVYKIKNGKSLSDALSIVLPSTLLSMVQAGEKSGTLGKMLHDAAEVIDKKVDMTLEALTKLFEPTVIVIMGGAVLFAAIAFYQLYAGMLGSLFGFYIQVYTRFC